MRNRYLIALLSILFFAGCKRTKLIREKLYIKIPIASNLCNKPAMNEPCEYITVWIHGTKLTPRAILPRIFHTPNGLVKASSFDGQYHLRTIADTLSSADPVQYGSGYMFLFGWSGALGFQERVEAAKNLYTQLKQVIKAYELDHHKKPKIRIITHSHGGNVALNLAKIKDDCPLNIDELILLACPVQEETAPYIKDSLFKEVFVIYSSLDLLQIIDPQGLYPHDGDRPLFSQRRFPVQDNITQVKLKLNGHALFHSDFIRIRFISMLPQIIQHMRTFHDKLGCNCQAFDEHDQHILAIYTQQTKKHRHKKCL